MNQVIALIELESLVRIISSNWSVLEVTDAGSVPGWNDDT
jgi:hypothetical protein